jgi:hypothetical protein
MTLSIILITGAVCGVIMILGGMILLYKGIITLDQKTKEGALTVEVKDFFKINTQYPALGIFVLGLVALGLSTYFGRVETVEMIATIKHPHPIDVRIQGCAAGLTPTIMSTGEYDEDLPVSTDPVTFRVSAPGYNDQVVSGRRKSARWWKEMVQLPDVVMDKPVVADKPAPAPGDTAIADPKVVLPPKNAAPSFNAASSN